MYVELGFHRYIGYYSAMPKLPRKAGMMVNDILLGRKVEIQIKNKDKVVSLGLAPLHRPTKTIKGIIGNNRILSLSDKL